MKPKLGDKVRVKVGSHWGERGIVEAIAGDKLSIRLQPSGKIVHLLSRSVTNYSLAARKAWITGPNRAVGRRKGTKLYDRVSVTLRIDRCLWLRFREMERLGVIQDRTRAINTWLRERLSQLEGAAPGLLSL